MIEKFSKNAKVKKFTNILGIVVRLIVIDPSFRQLVIFDFEMISPDRDQPCFRPENALFPLCQN